MFFWTYANFELTYANMPNLLTKISYFALNVRSCCVSIMKSLGCSVSVIIYPHKLNSAVIANGKVVPCIVTVKTISIV